MKSRTSFFNGTVLRKDITRYAPVWGLYTIGLVTFFLTPYLFISAEDKAQALIDSLSTFSIVNMVLAGICALLVYGDLFKTRLCYATHAMPLRREGWFLTHATAGLLFSVVPNLCVALSFLPFMVQYWYIPLLWLAANILQYLFFFGVAVFSANCAGNRLGAAAVYLMINLTTYLIGAYAEGVFTPLLFGIVYDGEFLNALTPVSMFGTMELILYTTRPFEITGYVLGDWLYLAFSGITGIGFACLAVLVYRKRHLETAGDFLSLNAMKPIFLFVYTLATGLLFQGLFLFVGLFVGIFVGVFTGKMLLERTVRVFKGRTFLYWGIFTTALASALILTITDPVGVTRYVPDTADVKSVHFYTSVDRYNYQSGEKFWAVTDPAEIDEFRQFHTDLSDGRHKDSDKDQVAVFVHYELKNGRTVLREYDVPMGTAEGTFARSKLSKWQAVFGSDDWSTVVNDMHQVELEIRSGEEIGQVTLTDKTQINGLLEALKQDCEAGNMAQNWVFHPDEESYAWVYFYDNAYYEFYEEDPELLATNYYGNMQRVYARNITIYECCLYTRAYLESLDLQITPYDK